MLALAASREEVERALREDVYAREGVWDLSKVRYEVFSFCASVCGAVRRGGGGRGREDGWLGIGRGKGEGGGEVGSGWWRDEGGSCGEMD